MARAIYEIKLANSHIPALSGADALDMFNAEAEYAGLKADEVKIVDITTEEQTMKLFLLAKTMTDTEKFSQLEVGAAVRALAREMGYYEELQEITDCVLTWIERFDELTLVELQEWLVD